MKIVLMAVLLFIPLTSGAACLISTTGLAFAAYDSRNTLPLDATGNIMVSCDGIAGQAITYTITLTSGNSGSFVNRRMTSGANSLNYNIYLNASYSAIWGDGNASTGILTDGYVAIAGMNVKNYAVYGRIPGNQMAYAGNYSDSVVVTATY